MDMTLLDALDGQEYIIKQINTDDEELNAFLFSLGCYVGEPVTVVSHLKGGCVVSIKDGRYNIDNQLALGHRDIRHHRTIVSAAFAQSFAPSVQL